MGREETVDSSEDLKQHSILDHHMKQIHINEAVMRRIDALQSRKQSRSYKPARRFPVYAAVIIILFLASASAYAASQFIEIRDAAGDVRITSIVRDLESKIIPYEKPTAIAKPTYRDRVLTMIMPGQLIAYYVRDGSSNPNIQYLHNTSIFSSYNDFQELLIRTSAPVIKEPVGLPKGFAFKYGSVMPLTPNEHDDRMSAEHSRLLELFQLRAAAEPDQDLFVEEVNWSEANISELEYENSSMTIRIQAMKNMIGMEVSFSSEYTQETVDVGGIDTIFSSGTMNGLQRYDAVWYDETHKTHYQVTASGNVDLTEQQFKQIVIDIIDR